MGKQRPKPGRNGRKTKNEATTVQRLRARWTTSTRPLHSTRSRRRARQHVRLCDVDQRLVLATSYLDVNHNAVSQQVDPDKDFTVSVDTCGNSDPRKNNAWR